MPQQTSGLRFDIYERVQLPDTAAPVKEFNGLELSPDIQVAVRGNQAVLHGHLALTGSYVGGAESGGGDDERLEHYIPVEITLPLHRVADVEKIQVEIENFDVDLLAPRTLNVTGVLLLEGVRLAVPSESAWRTEEEVVFTHSVESESAAAETSASEASSADQVSGNEAVPAEDAEQAAESEADADASAAEKEAVKADTAFQEKEAAAAGILSDSDTKKDDLLPNETRSSADAGTEPSETPSETAAAELKADGGAAPDASEAEPAPSGTEESGGDASPVSASASSDAEAAVAEAQEIKIQFSGKPPSSESATVSIQDIMTAAEKASHAAPPDIRDNENSGEAEAALGDADGRDRLEWKKLFLQQEETPAFRKMRMCIAQKEDTIETIAEKYQINARELMLYNRLKEPYLQEGQVIYIP